MTPSERELAAQRIQAHALAWCVGFASSDEIDACGIVAAGRLAALRALEGLSLYPDALLTDFRLELPELDIPQAALVKGDARCLSIAAASVLAKTARDALMRELDLQIPGYGLAQHKGYGTEFHRLAITRMGHVPHPPPHVLDRSLSTQLPVGARYAALESMRAIRRVGTVLRKIVSPGEASV